MKKMQATPGRLSLRKDVVTTLSENDMHLVNGGEAAWTTSFGNCSGWACCDKTQSEKILKVIGDALIATHNATIIGC